jgi:hypothetical protein
MVEALSSLRNEEDFSTSKTPPQASLRHKNQKETNDNAPKKVPSPWSDLFWSNIGPLDASQTL